MNDSGDTLKRFIGAGTVWGVVFFAAVPGHAQPASPAGSLDSVRGVGCYTYGDNETPAQAKKSAIALAQDQAVKSYRVYVQSSSTVKNFQLEDDLIQSASAGVLQDVQIEKQEKKEQEICVTITARISPVKLENLIQQKTTAKDVAQTAAIPLVASNNRSGSESGPTKSRAPPTWKASP